MLVLATIFYVRRPSFEVGREPLASITFSVVGLVVRAMRATHVYTNTCRGDVVVSFDKVGRVILCIFFWGGLARFECAS